MEWHFLHSFASHIVDESPKASNFERHCHNEFEILYVIRGSGDYVVEGTQYSFQSGSLLLLRPMEYHFVRPSEKEPYERYVIRFDSSALMDCASRLSFLQMQKHPSHGVYFCSDGFSLRIRPPFSTLGALENEQFSRHPARGEALLNSAITQILLLLSLEQTVDTDADVHPIVANAVEYLNNHLSDNLSLDRLAQEFFISKYYLSRLFRTHMGMPPQTYLSTKRLIRAKQLIDQGTSASEASVAVGFGDYSAFYRAFRKQFGYAPTQGKPKQKSDL